MSIVKKKNPKQKSQVPEGMKFEGKKKGKKTAAPVKSKPKPKPTISGREMLAHATDVVQRLAPDEVTVFSDRVLTRDLNTDQVWLEEIGTARRVPKDHELARKRFEEIATVALTAIIEGEFAVDKHEYDEIPFCPKDS